MLCAVSVEPLRDRGFGPRPRPCTRRHDVARHPALDQADVGGGLGIDPAERHRRDRPGRRQDGAAPLLRRDPGVGRPAAEREPEASAARARPARRCRSARRGRSSTRTRGQPGDVELLGPAQADLLHRRQHQLDPGMRAALAHEIARRRTASPPRRPCCRRRGSCRAAFVTTPSSTTGSIAAVGGTVSRWAFRKIGVPARWPAAGSRRCRSASRSRRRRRPRRPPGRGRAGTPITWSATARSLPGGLAIGGQLEEQVERLHGRRDQRVRPYRSPYFAHR